jgi:predicted GIY-YIG superfamily endonuclease
MVDPTERTALYRLRDADGRLLYIGIAKDPERRWKHHSRTARATRIGGRRKNQRYQPLISDPSVKKESL